MAKNLNILPKSDGSFEHQIDLADWLSSTAFGEVSIKCRGYDYATVQIVAETTLSWGSAAIDVRYSNNGVDGVEFSTPITFTAVGVQPSPGPINIQGIGYLHLANDAAAGTGKVRAFVQFHRAP